MAPHKNLTKPKDPFSAYDYFFHHYLEHEKKRLGGEFDSTGFAGRAREVWNQLKEEQQAYFNSKAASDKERHRVEMEAYLDQKQEKKKQVKKVKKVKDPNAPKKPLSAYNRFCNDERQRVKDMHPEFKFGDIAKELGRLWREASDEIKSQYQFMVQRDNERYQQEMAAYLSFGTTVKPPKAGRQ